jgi:hypothetical protein
VKKELKLLEVAVNNTSDNNNAVYKAYVADLVGPLWHAGSRPNPPLSNEPQKSIDFTTRLLDYCNARDLRAGFYERKLVRKRFHDTELTISGLFLVQRLRLFYRLAKTA